MIHEVWDLDNTGYRKGRMALTKQNYQNEADRTKQNHMSMKLNALKDKQMAWFERNGGDA